MRQRSTMPSASVSSSSSPSTGRRSPRIATQNKKTNDPQRPKSPPKRKAPTQKTPSSEKRQARFISRPTIAVRDRIDRVFEHRLYLIEKNQPSPSSCNFFVLGATGNVHTVPLELRPSCTCPDFQRGNTCKHILFVMLRVLKLPMNDSRVWQKALLSTEVQELVGISSVNEAVLADQRVRARFREVAGSSQGGEEKGKEEESVKTVQRKVEGDCPVCYEPLREDKEMVVFCGVCGNNVHEDCFMRWSRSKSSGIVTCIYCRAAWEEKDGGDRKANNMDYVNLAAYSDSHRPENTSLEALYPETSRWIHNR